MGSMFTLVITFCLHNGSGCLTRQQPMDSLMGCMVGGQQVAADYMRQNHMSLDRWKATYECSTNPKEST